MKKITGAIILLLMAPAILNALPSFARKHNINCFSCHYAPGYIRDFGMDYKLNGYRTEAEIGEVNETTQQGISDLVVLGKTFPISARVKSYIYKKTQSEERGEFALPEEAEFWFSGWLYKNISVWTEFEWKPGEFSMEMFSFGWHFMPQFNLIFGKLRIFNLDPVSTFADWGVRLTGQHKRPLDLSVGMNGWKMREAEPLIGFYGFLSGFFRIFYSAGLTHIGGGEDFEDFYFRAGVFPMSNIWLGGFGVMGKTEYMDSLGVVTNDFSRFGGDIQVMFGNIYLGGIFVMGSDKSALGQDIGVNHTAFDFELAYRYDMEKMGYLLPLIRFDSYTFSDNSKASQNDLILALFYFPVENVKFGFEYDYVLVAKDALGNDISNASDNSVLRLILDIFF